MYERVLTEQKMNLFKKIWYTVCEEKNFESEDFNPTAEHYLIKNDLGDYIGTIEIGKYHPEGFSTVQEYFNFETDKRIKENMKFVYEIDKVCIKKEARRNGGIETFVELTYEHAKKNQVKYYVGATEYIFYRAMRSYYGSVLEAKGEKIKYEGFYLVPTLINFTNPEEVLNKLQKRKSLLR